MPAQESSALPTEAQRCRQSCSRNRQAVERSPDLAPLCPWVALWPARQRSRFPFLGRGGRLGGRVSRASLRFERGGVDCFQVYLAGMAAALLSILGRPTRSSSCGGEGIVLFEPSVIAVDEETNNVLAVGEQAKEMIGRTPASIRATRPLRHGVITDFDVTEQMLRHFIRKAIGKRRLRRPRVVLCVPSGMTGVERDAVEEATRSAGAEMSP